MLYQFIDGIAYCLDGLPQNRKAPSSSPISEPFPQRNLIQNWRISYSFILGTRNLNSRTHVLRSLKSLCLVVFIAINMFVLKLLSLLNEFINGSFDSLIAMKTMKQRGQRLRRSWVLEFRLRVPSMKVFEILQFCMRLRSYYMNIMRHVINTNEKFSC